MLSSDWSRMDSCPASNTMYYKRQAREEREAGKKIVVKEQSFSQQQKSVGSLLEALTEEILKGHGRGSRSAKKSSSMQLRKHESLSSSCTQTGRHAHGH